MECFSALNYATSLGIAPIVTAAVALFAATISFSLYRGNSRQFRLSANERLMGMVLGIDKSLIDHPRLMCLIQPDDFPMPPDLSDDLRAQMIALMYVHLNMFDVAYNYYCNTLGMGWIQRKFLRTREELDHWEGWKT